MLTISLILVRTRMPKYTLLIDTTIQETGPE